MIGFKCGDVMGALKATGLSMTVICRECFVSVNGLNSTYICTYIHIFKRTNW